MFLANAPPVSAAGLVHYETRLFLIFGETDRKTFSSGVYTVDLRSPMRFVLLPPSGGVRPSPRSRFVYALQPPNLHNGFAGRFIMAFGISDESVTNEVWSMDLGKPDIAAALPAAEGAWRLEHGGVVGTAPTKRVDACCSYHEFRDTLTHETSSATGLRSYWRWTCFGGRTAEGPKDDLWAFDFRTNDLGPDAMVERCA